MTDTIAPRSRKVRVLATLGPATAVDQLRDAMALGILRGIHLVTDGDEWDPESTAAALVEAGAGKAGPTIDRILMQCYRYNPSSRRYEVFISTWFRVGGLLILATLGGFLYRFWRREAREGRRRAYHSRQGGRERLAQAHCHDR